MAPSVFAPDPYPAAWIIPSEDGARVLGRLVHPRNFEPFAAAEDWPLGRVRGELDVEDLELYCFSR